MLIDKSKDFIELVSANTVSTYDQTPANGKIWDVYEVAASIPDISTIKIEIKWGSTVIFVCHGNWPSESFDYQLTGDGTKVLSMRLVNDSNSSETIRLCMKAGEHG